MEELAIVISVICGALLLYWIYGIIIHVIIPHREKILNGILDIVKVVIVLFVTAVAFWFTFKGLNRCTPEDPETIYYDYDRSLHHRY